MIGDGRGVTSVVGLDASNSEHIVPRSFLLRLGLDELIWPETGKRLSAIKPYHIPWQGGMRKGCGNAAACSFILKQTFYVRYSTYPFSCLVAFGPRARKNWGGVAI